MARAHRSVPPAAIAHAPSVRLETGQRGGSAAPASLQLCPNTFRVLRSRQRLNFRRRRLFAAEPPVFQQFLSMLAFEDLQCADVDRGLELTISSVKVRRR